MHSRYNDMLSAFDIIITPYTIDCSTTDFFEEIILKLAGIEEKPDGCKFGVNNATSGENCNFDYVISEASAKKFVESLNEKFPALKAVDLTHTVTSNYVNDKAARFIRINTLAIHQHLLPLIATYLREHPEIALDYQKRHDFNHLADKLNEIFSKFAINIGPTDCFEETLCYTVTKNLKMNSRAMTLFQQQKQLIPDLANIALQYLCVNPKGSIVGEEEEANLPELITTTSRYSPNKQDKYATDLLVTLSVEHAKRVENYFNAIKSGSAKVASEQIWVEDKGRLMTMITITNRVLLNPIFLDSIKDSLEEYDQYKLDQYRVQSRTINRTTRDCVLDLISIQKRISTDYAKFVDPSNELVAAIKGLTDYVSEQGVKNSKHIDGLIVVIHSKRRILKGVVTLEMQLFEKFRMIGKEIKKAVQEISKIANNKFPPVPMRTHDFVNPNPPQHYNNFAGLGPTMRC
jgi:hypothetical protein